MNYLLPSTIQLLRFRFSIFLMPVYWFALSQVDHVHVANAILIFFILHLLVYPSSNGYNSYMDRDTSPIGGIKNPLQPTRQLFWVTVFMDVLAICLGLFISIIFSSGILFYILASRAYSNRKIRLKKYPVIGYLTVVVCQGALIYWLVFEGSSADQVTEIPFMGMLASSLLIGGFYPLTQIYQHGEDRHDGVKTISLILGYNQTFVFTGIVYALAFMVLGYYFYSKSLLEHFIMLQIIMVPVIVYFFIWWLKVAKDHTQANFKNTMRMNTIASLCSNLAFVILLIMKE